VGDWVIRETDGSGVYPCKADVFAETYEEVLLPPVGEDGELLVGRDRARADLEQELARGFNEVRPHAFVPKPESYKINCATCDRPKTDPLHDPANNPAWG
jgi:hypothetical protein